MIEWCQERGVLNSYPECDKCGSDTVRKNGQTIFRCQGTGCYKKYLLHQVQFLINEIVEHFGEFQYRRSCDAKVFEKFLR